MSEGNEKYDLEERLIQFAPLIIDIVEMLPNTRAGNHIAGQLIRSGTSPAFNYGEAQVAESRDDFIHKDENLPQRTERDTYCSTNYPKKTPY